MFSHVNSSHVYVNSKINQLCVSLSATQKYRPLTQELEKQHHPLVTDGITPQRYILLFLISKLHKRCKNIDS